MQNPWENHWKALQHTMHYQHSTIGQGISLKSTPQLTLQAFLTMIGGLALILDTQSLTIFYFLVIPLYHRSQISKARFPGQA